MMKKVFLVLGLLGLITSCSLNDDNGTNQQLVFVAIDSVQLPDTLVFGQQYELPISYTQPGNCYNFYDFQYEATDSTRYIGVINTVNTSIACDSTPRVDTRKLNLDVRYDNTYVFKFYQGDDANGDAKYLTKNVPVKRQ